MSRPKLWIKACVCRWLEYEKGGVTGEIRTDLSGFLWMVRDEQPEQEFYKDENIETWSTPYTDTVKILPWAQGLDQTDGWIEIHYHLNPILPSQEA